MIETIPEYLKTFIYAVGCTLTGLIRYIFTFTFLLIPNFEP